MHAIATRFLPGIAREIPPGSANTSKSQEDLCFLIVSLITESRCDSLLKTVFGKVSFCSAAVHLRIIKLFYSKVPERSSFAMFRNSDNWGNFIMESVRACTGNGVRVWLKPQRKPRLLGHNSAHTKKHSPCENMKT